MNWGCNSKIKIIAGKLGSGESDVAKPIPKVCQNWSPHSIIKEKNIGYKI